MASSKHLNAVAHDIAHHAVSGLSYIHPHLGAACRSANIDEITLDLSLADPFPIGFAANEPLKAATRALRKKFEDIIQMKGFSASEVRIATLRFIFSPSRSDDYSSVCFSHLCTLDGKEFHHRLEA